MQQQLHDIANTEGQRVPKVHSNGVRPKCKDYKSYSSQLQKSLGSLWR